MSSKKRFSLKKGILTFASLGLVSACATPIYFSLQNQINNTNIALHSNQNNLEGFQNNSKDSRASKLNLDFPSKPINDSLVDDMKPTTDLMSATISFNFYPTEDKKPGVVLEFGIDEEVVIDLSVTVTDNTYVKDHIKIELYFIGKKGEVLIQDTNYRLNQAKSIFINSNLMKDYQQLYAKVTLVNPLGTTRTISTNKLSFRINNKKYSTVVPTPKFININTVGTMFPLFEEIVFDNNVRWDGTECHNTLIQYNWWASDGSVKCLFKNCSGINGGINSEGTLFVLKLWALEVVVNGVSYWSSPMIFAPMEEPGEKPEETGPYIEQVTITSQNPSNEYFTGDWIVMNSSIKWNTVDAPDLDVVYRWYLIDEMNNQQLIYDQKEKDLNLRSSLEYNGKKIKLRVLYRGGIYTESNAIEVKVTKLIDYPIVESVLIRSDVEDAKYKNGDEITMESQIIWRNPIYTTKMKKYDWIITTRKGEVIHLDVNSPKVTFIVESKYNRASVKLVVTYANNESQNNIVSSEPIKLSVQTDIKTTPLTQESRIVILSVFTIIATIVIVATIVGIIGFIYKRDRDHYLE